MLQNSNRAKQHSFQIPGHNILTSTSVRAFLPSSICFSSQRKWMHRKAVQISCFKLIAGIWISMVGIIIALVYPLMPWWRHYKCISIRPKRRQSHHIWSGAHIMTRKPVWCISMVKFHWRVVKIVGRISMQLDIGSCDFRGIWEPLMPLWGFRGSWLYTRLSNWKGLLTMII